MGVEGCGAEGAKERRVGVVGVEGVIGGGAVREEGDFAEGGEVLGAVGGDVGEGLEVEVVF